MDNESLELWGKIKNESPVAGGTMGFTAEGEMFNNDASNRDTYSDTSHEDNSEKGGGEDEVELRRATFKKRKSLSPYDSNKIITDTVLVDESGKEYGRFQVLNTPEDKEAFKNDQSQFFGENVEEIFIVNINGVDTKVAVYLNLDSDNDEREDYGGY